MCRVMWRGSDDDGGSNNFTINFVKESQMLLWSLKLDEIRQKISKTDTAWI
jgi:hypothetical protein